MKKRLLLSGLGGSVFPNLHNHLKETYELFYVDANSYLCSVYPNYNFFKSPLVNDSTYWDFIKDIIKSEGINYYIPLIDEEIVPALQKISGYCNVRIISPCVEFAKLSLNKYFLMQELAQKNISTVLSYTGDKFKWEIDPPVFVKPISGRGSRGIKRIENKKQMAAYYDLENYNPSEILIQELLEGTEYTVGILTNNLNDVLSISSKRIVSKKGITQIAVTENNFFIDAISLKVVQELQPCGPINIQLILTPDNQIKIFEINPRFSTTTIMEFEGGLDLISLYIDNYDLSYSGEINRPKTDLMLYRRWETLFYENQ